MTNKQPDAQFDWATELLDAEGHVTLSAKEAKEIGARLRSMGEKLKTYEDLDEAASDVQLLRMGYAAARLEIESLQARIKTMAEDHADELMVAHLDGRMRAVQPAGAQHPTTQPAPQQEAQEPVAWRELCRRLYVELYYCNQQMTSGKRPKWQQGETVRDVLADAKAALDAAPQPTPTPQADSVTAPAGWKLVPVAPTQEMLDAGFNSTWSHSYTSCWRAMISAAPTPPAQAADSVLEDAERYRWLRQEHERVDPVCHLTWKRNLQLDSAEWVNTAVLDTAIDNARTNGDTP